MLTLTHPSSKDLLWVGDKGIAWSDLDVQEHFLEVIYDSGKIDTPGVIDRGTISADSLWYSDNNVATGKS